MRGPLLLLAKKDGKEGEPVGSWTPPWSRAALCSVGACGAHQQVEISASESLGGADAGL